MGSYKQTFIESRRVQNRMAANNKISEMAQPNPADVIEAVKDLPTSGVLAQDGYTGMVYLDLENAWVFKALEVLEDFGYISPPFFVFPPVPLGAHVKIISEREAVDYELVGEREGKKEIPGLGKIVDFKVVDAFPFHPQIRVYGVESRYEIRIESAVLDKIRMDLTGLPPKDLGFCINVGVRMENMLGEKTEEETKTSSKTSTTKPMPEPEVESVELETQQASISTSETRRNDDEEETKASEVKVASASKTKSEKTSSKTKMIAGEMMRPKPKLPSQSLNQRLRSLLQSPRR